MYLVDENNKPITANVTYQEDKQWKHRNDTLFFWDNKKAKERAGDRPLLRQKFYNIGDSYTVAFRLEINALKDPLHYPIYKLKVESGFNEKTENLYASQTFHLPIHKAVRICNNNVADDFKPSKPVETLDGKAFKPIDIILNEEKQAEVEEEINKLQYTVSDGYMLGLGVVIPTISNNCTVYYNADSSINYAIANPYKSRFATAIFTFPNGSVRAKGTVQDKDTTIKVGKWDYYKQDTWGLDEKVYSKSVTLSTVNESYYYDRTKFKINILENKKWKEPIIETANYGLRFYITPETDSIKAFTDTTNYTFALPYNKLPNDIIKQVYLLKPNEPTLVVNAFEKLTEEPKIVMAGLNPYMQNVTLD
ncbi:unnamed protein product [Rotaria sp. Silwood1]|nr:unnamed protein product [Rotaria sp. Silwood1]CAF4762513.1 unnamed protein product [Rotaria sp. Silwood1]